MLEPGAAAMIQYAGSDDPEVFPLPPVGSAPGAGPVASAAAGLPSLAARFGDAHKIDLSRLSPPERRRLGEIVARHPTLDSATVLGFGAAPQRQVNGFLDELLQGIATGDTGAAGDLTIALARGIRRLNLEGMKRELAGQDWVAGTLGRLPLAGSWVSALRYFQLQHREIISHLGEIEAKAQTEITRLQEANARLDQLALNTQRAMRELELHPARRRAPTAGRGRARAGAQPPQTHRMNPHAGRRTARAAPTDGHNDDSDEAALVAAIAQRAGRFQCDAWGLGLDWQPAQLRLIAQGLLGRADAVTDPATLDAALREALGGTRGRALGQVRLRLQTPRSCRVISLQQQSPEIVELFGLGMAAGDGRSFEVPLGACGNESRDYFVAVELQPLAEGEEAMAFRPKVLYVDQGTACEVEGSRVIAHWTADLAPAADIDPQVAHCTDQQDLAESIRDGLAAKYRGDLVRATLLLGRAVQISADSGNAAVTQRLGRVAVPGAVAAA